MKGEESDLVFPYAFLNTDRDLVTAEMMMRSGQLQDGKQATEEHLKRHNKVLAEVSTLLDPSHESALQSHFRELFLIYLEALAQVETDPAGRLEQICEPLFH